MRIVAEVEIVTDGLGERGGQLIDLDFDSAGHGGVG